MPYLGCTCTWTLFIVYLKLNLTWVTDILSGSCPPGESWECCCAGKWGMGSARATRAVSWQTSLVTNPGFQFGAPLLFDNVCSSKKKTTKQSKKQYQFLGQLVHLLKLRWYLRKKLGLYRTWVQIPAWRLAHRKPLSFSEPQNLISEMKTRIPAYLSCWEDCDNVCKLPSAKGKV